MSASPPTRTERRYRGMTADDRREDRRRRLLDAALERFGTQGYAATTIEDLAVTAGVTARHLYEQFSSREELLVALYDELIAVHLGALAASIPDDAADLEQVARDGAVAMLEGWTSDPRKARIAFLEVVGVSARVEERRLAVLDEYARFIAGAADRLAARGLLAERDRTLVGVALVGAVSQLIVHWLGAAERPPIAALAEQVASIELALLRHA